MIYVLVGLPLARLADTGFRSLVLVVGLTFWSAMVLLTGFAQAFWQLLVLRIFLGIGEVRLQYCRAETMICYIQVLNAEAGQLYTNLLV